MVLCKVLGPVVATEKHPAFARLKLLVVQPLMADAKTADGDPQIAVDVVGAGKEQVVMITSDGKFIREVVKHENTPIRWSVIGIADA